jgi:WD40 repeat protein
MKAIRRVQLVLLFVVTMLVVAPGTSMAAGSVRDLGPMLFTKTILGGAFGPGPNGEQWAYTVNTGEVATFQVLDAITGERIDSFDLPAAGGSWGQAVAPDGTVYVGTWPNAHLYRYRPGASKVEDLGQPPGFEGEPFAIWRVVTDGQGRVYGGTSGSTPGDGRVFRYDPDTDTFKDLGVAFPGDGTVRSIAFSHGRVYAGTGEHLHVVEIDPETGAKREIRLPDHAYTRTPADAYIYDVFVRQGYLLARAEPSKTLYVYDLAKQRWVDEESAVLGLDFSPVGVNGDVWLVKDGVLQRYDLDSLTMSATDFDASYTRGLNWVDVEGPDFPGRSLVSFTGTGDAWIYNPSTGASRRFTPDIKGQPATLRSLGTGPDGDIYGSAYLAGGLAAYDPDTDTLRQYPPGVGQAGTITAIGDKLYLGTYPSAHLVSFGPSQPFDFGRNPVNHFDLSQYGQFRVWDIEAAGSKVAMATVAGGSETEGTLTIFDPGSGEHEVHKGIVADRSIWALAYRDGVLYASAGDQLFAWDVAAGQKLWQVTPGLGHVTALDFAPDGTLWGMSTTGKLFAFDIGTRAVTKSADLYPGETWDENVDALLRHSEFDFAPDGQIVGTTLGHLFQADMQTLSAQTLADGAYAFAQGRDGDLYFTRGQEELLVYER